MKEFEQLVRSWDLISGGSLECTLWQENDVFALHLTPTTATIDIRDPVAMEFVNVFFQRLELRVHATEHIRRRGSIILGALAALNAKRKEINEYITMIQGIAKILAGNKKTVVLKENGKQLARLGYSADSAGMRLLNLEHIEVNDLSALMRLAREVNIG
jgi:hypothetical protein